jgi:hypothetical protein
MIGAIDVPMIQSQAVNTPYKCMDANINSIEENIVMNNESDAQVPEGSQIGMKRSRSGSQQD